MRRRAPARITTRGYYNRNTGMALKGTRYGLYPAGCLKNIYGVREIVIFAHGMHNDSAGAASKFRIIRRRLLELGYTHPVIGYSYDADVGGRLDERRALRLARTIARKNGSNLARFIAEFARSSPDTKIRLAGHSLGTEVIISAALRLGGRHKKIISSMHLFGASADTHVPSRRAAQIRRAISGYVKNYYAPTDEVLSHGAGRAPLGLVGASGRTWSGYIQRRVRPKNHRFRSYAAVLRSFP